MKLKAEDKYNEQVALVVLDKKEAIERKRKQRFESVNVLEDEMSFDEKELEFGY